MRETKFLSPPSRRRARERERFRADVLRGLALPQKELPCKYLYDERGSKLFERICGLEEYYVSRTELRILEEHVEEMAAQMGEEGLIVEPGSGSSRKTRLLLDHLEDPVAYVPVDISRDFLLASAQELAAAYPRTEILPVCADFTEDFRIPAPQRPAWSASLFFPGSTLGNFHPPEAEAFLRRFARLLPSGTMLIGVDLKKDPAMLERAYDDAEGVTAEFNLNLLRRINRELGGDFRLERFRHRSVYDADQGRIEMDLVSARRQRVRVDDVEFFFDEGEALRTEHSYKYGFAEFRELATAAGLEVRNAWADPDQLFSLFLCAPAA